MTGKKSCGWLKWASGLALLAVVAGFAYGLESAHRWLTAEGRFPVTEIRVSGNRLLYEGEILAAAGVERGENILTVDPESVRARLLASGWIREATVRRRPPGRVLVDVVERIPWLLAAGELPRFADRGGRLFPTMGKEERLDLPLLEDPSGKAEAVLPALAAAFPPDDKWFAEKVVEVSIDLRGSVTLVERDHGTKVRLGSGTFETKAVRLRTVFDEWKKCGEAFEEIDFRFDGQAIARRPIPPPEEKDAEADSAAPASDDKARRSV